MGGTNCSAALLWCIRNLGGIAGLMVSNLKAQKFVHGGDGVGVLRGDADARAMLGVFELVLDRFAQTLHGLRAGRILGVNQHGRGEIAGCQHLCDVTEVHANFIERGSVVGLVGLDVDGAAIGVEKEVMRGFVMGEAHDAIAALDDALVMVVLRGRLVLRKGVESGKDQ